MQLSQRNTHVKIRKRYILRLRQFTQWLPMVFFEKIPFNTLRYPISEQPRKARGGLGFTSLFPSLAALRKNKKGFLYVASLFIVGIFLVAIVWFGCYYILVKAVPAANKVAQHIGSNSTTYNMVDTFFSNVWYWAGVIGLIGLMFSAYVYSQRKGERT